jgi:hypothetical protein
MWMTSHRQSLNVSGNILDLEQLRMSLDKHHRLPSQELAYHFTVAMHFGQQLELNLRAVLYTADYHGWGADLELTTQQIERFKKNDAFIEAATCGTIISAIRKKRIIKEEKILQVFERACAHRNRLAHSFLSEQNFDSITIEQETKLIGDLNKMTEDLYKAARLSQAFRSFAEAEVDKETQRIRDAYLEFLGADYQNPNAKYSTRTPKRTRKS